MDLLTLLAENDGFGKEELDRLWTVAEGQHSSLKRIVFNVIFEVAPSLSVDVTTHLVEGKLEGIPDSEFDDPTLNFVLRLAQTSGKLHLSPQLQKKGKFGINIFWKLLQSSSKSPLGVKELAGRYLLKVSVVFFILFIFISCSSFLFF